MIEWCWNLYNLPGQELWAKRPPSMPLRGKAANQIIASVWSPVRKHPRRRWNNFDLDQRDPKARVCYRDISWQLMKKTWNNPSPIGKIMIPFCGHLTGNRLQRQWESIGRLRSCWRIQQILKYDEVNWDCRITDASAETNKRTKRIKIKIQQ